MSALVAVPAAAFIAVGIWILWDATSSEVSKAFVSTPQFVLWALIVEAQAAVWTLTLSYVWSTVSRRARELRAARAFTLPTLLGLGLALAMLVVLPLAELSVFDRKFLGILPIPLEHVPKPDEFPLAHYKLKVRVLYAFGALVTLLAIAGTLLTALAFNRLQPAWPPNGRDLERFLALRNDLGALLDIAAVLVGMATLATGTLRVAVLATNREPYFMTHPGKMFEFAPGFVLAYGLFFTGLLAFAFAPGFLTMRAAAARLRERAHPLPAPTDPEFAAVVTRRKALDEVLQTNLWASATLKGCGGAIDAACGQPSRASSTDWVTARRLAKTPCFRESPPSNSNR